MGVLRSDGSIRFFTSSGMVEGRLADLTTFHPIAAELALGTPFSVAEPSALLLALALALVAASPLDGRVPARYTGLSAGQNF